MDPGEINHRIVQLLEGLRGRRFGMASSKSMYSLANLISLNEAINLLSSIQYNTAEKNSELKEKVREGYTRIISLDKTPDRPTISPFNPTTNFYVWSVNTGRGPLIIEALGRNISEVLWSLISYIIEYCYNATIKPAKYKSYIYNDQGNKIGEVYFAKEKGDQNKTCLIGRVKRDDRLEKILARYKVSGFIIRITINCPEHVKHAILPQLKRMEEKLITLLQHPEKMDHS